MTDTNPQHDAQRHDKQHVKNRVKISQMPDARQRQYKANQYVRDMHLGNTQHKLVALFSQPVVQNQGDKNRDRKIRNSR